jgi:hypothetical protein
VNLAPAPRVEPARVPAGQRAALTRVPASSAASTSRACSAANSAPCSRAENAHSVSGDRGPGAALESPPAAVSASRARPSGTGGTRLQRAWAPLGNAGASSPTRPGVTRPTGRRATAHTARDDGKPHRSPFGLRAGSPKGRRLLLPAATIGNAPLGLAEPSTRPAAAWTVGAWRAARPASRGPRSGTCPSTQPTCPRSAGTGWQAGGPPTAPLSSLRSTATRWTREGRCGGRGPGWAARIDDEPLAAPLPRLHDARHAWAVAMLRSGIAPAALARLGGWADVGIIHRRYGRRALPDELDGAGRALGAWRASRRLERAAQALAYRVDRPTLHETVIAYGEIHRLALLLEPTGGAGGHSPSSPTGEEIAAAMRQSEFPPRDMFGPWARGEKDPPVVRFLRWISRSSVTH